MPDPQAATAPAPVEAPPERPDFPGVVTAKQSRIISIDFNGEVKQLVVRPRQRVKAGDLLAKIDDRALRSELDQVIANEKSARAEAGSFAAAAQQAKQQMKTDKILISRGIAPANQLRSSTASYKQSAGNGGAAMERAEGQRARRVELEELIVKADLKSPIDGVITMIKIKEGEVAQKGTPLARVFDDHDMIIRFAVPREYRSLVREGLRVELQPSTGGEPIWATITTVADEEPPITFAVVEADIDDSKLRPDEIQVASEGRVRIADAQPQGAKR